MQLTVIAMLAVAATSGMARIPAGSYRPLYATASASRVAVSAFLLDRDPVSRGEYRAFVRANAAWRRSAVARTVADSGYLADWMSDDDAGADSNAPVTGVSWFAAKAYCEAKGKRLPTVDEWEYAAAADDHHRDARADPTFRNAVLAAYSSRHQAKRTTLATNVYGVRGLHDRVWEWTLDFNPSVTMHHHTDTEHHAFCASAALGASDPSNYPAFLRNAVRSGLTPRSTLSGLGFRCAAN